MQRLVERSVPRLDVLRSNAIERLAKGRFADGGFSGETVSIDYVDDRGCSIGMTASHGSC